MYSIQHKMPFGFVFNNIHGFLGKKIPVVNVKIMGDEKSQSLPMKTLLGCNDAFIAH